MGDDCHADVVESNGAASCFVAVHSYLVEDLAESRHAMRLLLDDFGVAVVVGAAAAVAVAACSSCLCCSLEL